MIRGLPGEEKQDVACPPRRDRCEDLLCDSLAQNEALCQLKLEERHLPLHMSSLLSKEWRPETEGTMKAQLRHREDLLYSLLKGNRGVRPVSMPGEYTRRLADAGLQKLLLGEADPHPHVVVGRASRPCSKQSERVPSVRCTLSSASPLGRGGGGGCEFRKQYTPIFSKLNIVLLRKCW